LYANNPIVISNDDNFIDKIKEIQNSDNFSYDHLILKFPSKLNLLYVKGEGYNKTIKSEIMDALNQRQANINKFYSLLIYGHIQNLTTDEKKKVEIIFSINEGSSQFIEENAEKIYKVCKCNIITYNIVIF
jgi:hypothetical protein